MSLISVASPTSHALLARPYESYVYAYPHKTAYRPLDPAPALSEVWHGEQADALSLYAHIPFCEVRCGFCNLFTRIGAPDELTTRYLDALERQASQTFAALEAAAAGRPRFANAAIGGGTPTFLEAAELCRLLDILETTMGADLGAIPLSVEASPSTATPDRLAVLAERGTTRLSLGVQSFDPAEARAAVRPQKAAEVHRALAAIRETAIPVLNIDLIYGIDGQTEQSWLASLDAALTWAPEELYLYPLYIRPLTGLGRTADPADPETALEAWDEQRLRLYRAGRDHLRGNGYEQTSMRMFRRIDASGPGGGGGRGGGGSGGGGRAEPAFASGGDYSCQSDGMIGLGCGARSYTAGLHYSFDYAVSAHEVRGIIDAYTTTEDFRRAEIGYGLSEDEQRRRHLLQSLLQAEGLDEAEYTKKFGSLAREDFARELVLLEERGLLEEAPTAPSPADSRLRLTPEGLAWSDAIGPMLFSDPVRAAMRAYALK
ncbi:STM4012 family radical SAM protein [Actinospica robiniae]|uniref:STM4012 family radical SAM protein n=1 Tax=Actinospica robiniae TaxID=304901 RepID=UPI00054EFA3E|nr:STM4012 family radical SAM protein [Actinospica robiniae]